MINYGSKIKYLVLIILEWIVLKDENTDCKVKQMGRDQIILLRSILIFEENYFTVVNFKRNCPGFVNVIG